jgi:hypothetical protein
VRHDQSSDTPSGRSRMPSLSSEGHETTGLRLGQLNRRVFVAILVGLLVCLLAASVLATNYEVLDKRPVCATCEDQLYQVRLFDSFNISVKPDYKPTPDAISGYFLVTISSMALLAFVFLQLVVRRIRSRVRWFFVVTWIGALYLAADELFGIHESIGYNMTFLADLPGVERADDVVFAAYVVPVVAYLVAFRKLLFSSTHVRALYGAALALFLIGSLGDVLSLGPVEDLIEILASICIVVAFMIVTIEQMAATQIGAAAEVASEPGPAPRPTTYEARGAGAFAQGAAPD